MLLFRRLHGRQHIDNEIHYISAGGEVVNPYNNAFGDGVAILSNTYENGQGIITFSAPVTTIGTNAFYDCSSLTYVYCRPATPPSLGLIVFSTLVTTIYVPRESVEAYRTAEGWSNYADRMVGYNFFYVRRRPS